MPADKSSKSTIRPTSLQNGLLGCRTRDRNAHAFFALTIVSALLTSVSAKATPVFVPDFTYQATGTGTATYRLAPTPSITSNIAPGQTELSIFNYFFDVFGPTNTTASLDLTAFLSATETFSGSNVQYFGTLPQYDEFALLNIGRSQWVSGNPGILFAGIGSDSTRSGINGSNVGGQIGYLGSTTTTVDTSADGLTKTATTKLGLQAVFSIPTNTIFDIELYASISGAYNSPGLLISYGADTVDPYLMLDPAFASNNPEFSLIISPSVGNAPPQLSVPEPASITLLGGAGLFWLNLRRAQRKKAPARLPSLPVCT